MTELERSGSLIVLFDGECNFCNGTVRFIFARDTARYFRFAPLDSEPGRALRRRYGVFEQGTETLMLVEDGRVWTRSTAVLRIAGKLDAPWPALMMFLSLPRPVRDALYDRFARMRYVLFGRQESCPLPPPGLRERFLSGA